MEVRQPLPVADDSQLLSLAFLPILNVWNYSPVTSLCV